MSRARKAHSCAMRLYKFLSAPAGSDAVCRKIGDDGIPTMTLLRFISRTAIVASIACLVTAQPRAVSGNVSILVYHRFEPEVHDSMAVTTTQFARHLEYLADHHQRVIPFRSVVASLQRHEPLPSGVVITVDDGHRSVYTDMLPLVRKYRVPVT